MNMNGRGKAVRETRDDKRVRVLALPAPRKSPMGRDASAMEML